jgi:hypothetical protein
MIFANVMMIFGLEKMEKWVAKFLILMVTVGHRSTCHFFYDARQAVANNY